LMPPGLELPLLRDADRTRGDWRVLPNKPLERTRRCLAHPGRALRAARRSTGCRWADKEL